MIKGILKTYNPAGTFLLPFSNICYQHFTEHGNIAYFAYIVPPQGYQTQGIVNLLEPNFISKVTKLDDDYFCRFDIYKYSPVNYVTS